MERKSFARRNEIQDEFIKMRRELGEFKYFCTEQYERLIQQFEQLIPDLPPLSSNEDCLKAAKEFSERYQLLLK